MTPQYQTALLRGVVAAVVTAGFTFFSAAANADFGDAGVSAGTAFFSVLVIRGLGEGSLDTNRARRISGPSIPATN